MGCDCNRDLHLLDDRNHDTCSEWRGVEKVRKAVVFKEVLLAHLVTCEDVSALSRNLPHLEIDVNDIQTCFIFLLNLAKVSG